MNNIEKNNYIENTENLKSENNLNKIPSIDSYNEEERNTVLFKEQLWAITKTIERKYILKQEVIQNSNKFWELSMKKEATKFLTFEWLLKNISPKTNLDDIFHLWQKFSIFNPKTWEKFNVVTKETNWKMAFVKENWEKIFLENWLKIEDYIEENQTDENIFEENIFENKNQDENYTEEKTENTKEKIKNIEISKKELHNLTAIAFAEAFWDAWEIWISAVVNVILNRKRLWWKSINQIIFEKWQFSPIRDWRFKRFSKSITENDKNLVKQILNWEIKNPIWNATFFQNKNAEKSRWNWQKKAPTLAHNKKVVIWNHIFRTEKQFLA